jgi:hypothetical protein
MKILPLLMIGAGALFLANSVSASNNNGNTPQNQNGTQPLLGLNVNSVGQQSAVLFNPSSQQTLLSQLTGDTSAGFTTAINQSMSGASPYSLSQLNTIAMSGATPVIWG